MGKGTNIVGLDLNIDDDYLTEAVKQTVIMGISEALNGKNEIVSQLVTSVLETKCRPDGTLSSYKGENTCTLLEAYVKKAIRDIAKEELADVIEDARPAMKKQIRKAITDSAKQGQIVDAFIDSLIANINSQFRTTVNVNFDRDY